MEGHSGERQNEECRVQNSGQIYSELVLLGRMVLESDGSDVADVSVGLGV